VRAGAARPDRTTKGSDVILTNLMPGQWIEFNKTGLRQHISEIRAELRRMEAALADDDGPLVHAIAATIARRAEEIAVARIVKTDGGYEKVLVGSVKTCGECSKPAVTSPFGQPMCAEHYRAAGGTDIAAELDDLCGSCGVAGSACSWSQNPSAGRGDCCPTCNHTDD
jgi:hypothetical protein